MISLVVSPWADNQVNNWKSEVFIGDNIATNDLILNCKFILHV